MDIVLMLTHLIMLFCCVCIVGVSLESNPLYQQELIEGKGSLYDSCRLLKKHF